jgi:hypothetical protein
MKFNKMYFISKKDSYFAYFTHAMNSNTIFNMRALLLEEN